MSKYYFLDKPPFPPCKMQGFEIAQKRLEWINSELKPFTAVRDQRVIRIYHDEVPSFVKNEELINDTRDAIPIPYWDFFIRLNC